MKVTKDNLLRPSQVALVLGVDPRTVSRWAKEGKISCEVLPSGHRRFRGRDIIAFQQKNN